MPTTATMIAIVGRGSYCERHRLSRAFRNCTSHYFASFLGFAFRMGVQRNLNIG
jgi:hypothetical protein